MQFYKITETEMMRLSTMSTRSDTMRRRASAALYVNDLVSISYSLCPQSNCVLEILQ